MTGKFLYTWIQRKEKNIVFFFAVLGFEVKGFFAFVIIQIGFLS
jgi:hypothetical protein